MPTIRQVHSLEGQDAPRRILQAALDAVRPAEVVRRSLRLEAAGRLVVAGAEYDLAAFENIHLLAIGKAAPGLARALEDMLGERISRGLVIAKTGPDRDATSRFPLLTAGHPIPDEGSLAAGRAVLDLLAETGPRDLLICALSGGASALLAAPQAPLNLQELQDLTARLLASGAAIDEINTLRRHLDRLKGGGFLRQTQATVLGLLLSDVIGNPPEAIGSGPTAPDPTTRADALAILKKYKLRSKLSKELVRLLEHVPETLKPGEARLENVRNFVIGSNLLAIQAGLKQAEREGFHPYLLRADLAGEARQAAGELCQALRWARQRGEPVARPFCMIAGGETTVTLRGKGRGGRNTELALAAVTELADFPGVLLATLATDGEDGPTDAAGAVVTGASWRRARALGLRPADHLRRNDAYTFFAALDDLLRTGPTGTNVNDLVFLFGF